jgi:hypothetical protein
VKESQNNIRALVESIEIDKFHISCLFRCSVTKRSVLCTLPFEPYEGKIEFTWQEIVFHPINSYNKYYHTPINVYSESCQETILLKAFEKVSDNFIWNEELKKYVYK